MGHVICDKLDEAVDMFKHICVNYLFKEICVEAYYLIIYIYIFIYP